MGRDPSGQNHDPPGALGHDVRPEGVRHAPLGLGFRRERPALRATSGTSGSAQRKSSTNPPWTRSWHVRTLRAEDVVVCFAVPRTREVDINRRPSIAAMAYDTSRDLLLVVPAVRGSTGRRGRRGRRRVLRRRRDEETARSRRAGARRNAEGRSIGGERREAQSKTTRRPARGRTSASRGSRPRASTTRGSWRRLAAVQGRAGAVPGRREEGPGLRKGGKLAAGDARHIEGLVRDARRRAPPPAVTPAAAR